MNIVDEVLVILGSTVGGVSVATLLFFFIKFIFNKFSLKSQIKAITNALTNNASPEIVKKVLEGIKDTTFSHSIEPILVSDLEKINEIALKDFSKKVEILSKKYDNIINIFDKLSACFENSAIPQTTKDALKTAIEQAKEVKVEVVEATVEIEAPKKAPKKEQKIDVLL